MRSHILPGLGVALALSCSALATPDTAHAADRNDRRALVGAGIGALAGALLSDGDPWAVVGGALAGGVVGNATAPNDRERDRQRFERERREADRIRRERWEEQRRFEERRNNDRRRDHRSGGRW